MHLPLYSNRRSSFGCRHYSWWCVGRLFMGTILGVGSQRSVGPDSSPSLFGSRTWKVCRLAKRFWFSCVFCDCFSRCTHGLVRSKLRIRCRSPCLWFWFRWLILCFILCINSNLFYSCFLVY